MARSGAKGEADDEGARAARPGDAARAALREALAARRGAAGRDGSGDSGAGEGGADPEEGSVRAGGSAGEGGAAAVRSAAAGAGAGSARRAGDAREGEHSGARGGSAASDAGSSGTSEASSSEKPAAPVAAPRPGDAAREALRAARAKMREESETAAQGERKPGRGRPVPGESVAGERVRDLKSWLSGAFRMPPEAEEAQGQEGETGEPGRAPGAQHEPYDDVEREVGPAPEAESACRPQPAPKPDSKSAPQPQSESESDDAPTPWATPAPPPTDPVQHTPGPDPTPISDLLAHWSQPPGTRRPSAAPRTPEVPRTPASSQPPYVPRTMASPSRDGDLRRTFPALPSQEPPFARTWWGQAWVSALEGGALDAARLLRGKGYAEGGRVDAITVTPGSVLAYVQGSRPRPYRVQVRLRTWEAEDWERFLGAAVERPGQIAALLDKEVPPSLAAESGMPLLPVAGELEPQCSCPDHGYPCKHAAALCYQTARLLDADPFVLLLLRGRGERDLLDTLARRSAAHAARTARERETEDLPGVRATDAIARRAQLPSPPAPLPVPRH
ncbi:SWIM zinc finger family protein, partial [Streptomyces sp. S6]